MHTPTAATTETLALAKSLIDIESITPHDNGAQEIIKNYLAPLGFKFTDLSCHGVTNLFATRGTEGPLVVFSGHTDVVPPGPKNLWRSDPFTATIHDNCLYGRGAADMKGAIAAMLTACKQFIQQHPQHPGQIAFMITSDEEGPSIHGSKYMVNYLLDNHIKLDYCIIGEASSQQRLGDGIKIGRRGSLHGNLQVIGKQGHIAYPQLADNPIHRSFKVLDKLSHNNWDQGNDHFDPTSFQIYNIHADTGASNIIPGSLTASFNFRFSPASSAEDLKQKVHRIFDQHELHYSIDWNLASTPFLSPSGKLHQICREVIKEICHIDTHPNTMGGTSDGRFIAATGCELVELGVVNKTIHQVNEHVNIDDLNTLSTLYASCLTRLLHNHKYDRGSRGVT